MQLFVENLLKVLKVLKTQLEAVRQSAGKLRHALRTAHRAYRMTFKAKSDKTFFKKQMDHVRSALRPAEALRLAQRRWSAEYAAGRPAAA